MKIRTIWKCNPDEPDAMPWLVAAVDEYTIEEHSGLPEFYSKELGRANRREMVIEVPEREALKLFAVPEVRGEVK